MLADTALRACSFTPALQRPSDVGALACRDGGVPGSNAHAEPAAWKTEGWNKTDFSKTRIGWNEIFSGGPPKDGIPSIDKPAFKAVGDEWRSHRHRARDRLGDQWRRARLSAAHPHLA